MSWWFASGHAVDLVLLVLAIESGWLIMGRNRNWADVAGALLPGALMLLALRAALTGAGWPWIAIWLTASFPVHIIDLRRRRL